MKNEKHSNDDLLGAAKILKETRTGLLLTGRIEKGKLHLDKSTLREIEERFADADQAFVALNSPFDPNSQIST